MSDILIRDLKETVVAEIDAQASRLGISHTEYVRRQLIDKSALARLDRSPDSTVRSERTSADLQVTMSS